MTKRASRALLGVLAMPLLLCAMVVFAATILLLKLIDEAVSWFRSLNSSET